MFTSYKMLTVTKRDILRDLFVLLYTLFLLKFSVFSSPVLLIVVLNELLFSEDDPAKEWQMSVFFSSLEYWTR